MKTSFPVHHQTAALRKGRPAVRPTSTPFSFQGEVVDGHTLAPVAGARAALAEPLDLLGRLLAPRPSRSRTGLSDGIGRFELAVPADRPFWLLVHHPDFLPEVVEMKAGATGLRVALRRPGAIHGRLLDASGRPVAGARVRALCPEIVDATEAVTRDDGSFRMDGVRPGRWLLAPDGGSADGVAAAVIDVEDGSSTLAVLRPRRAQAPESC